MARFVLRRLGLSVLVISGVILLTFVLATVVPGDPAVAWAGPDASQADLEAARDELGLDRPLPERIVGYFGGVLTGDWGTSASTRQPVLKDILDRLPASLELAVAAMLLAIAIGIPAGVMAARHQGRGNDYALRFIAILGVSVPVFWLGLILQLVFFQQLGWLPVAGMYDPDLMFESPLTEVTHVPIVDALITGNWPIFWSSVEHLILPALALAAWPVGLVTRMTRATVLDVSRESYVVMARALGFSERQVFFRFALRAAWVPIVQTLGLIFAGALVYTFLVETVFNWPGLGSYASRAVSTLDVAAVIGLALFVGILYVFTNLAVDLIQAALDPRIGLR